MFVGKYCHSVDAKGRIIMPAKFREQLGDTFVITAKLDDCLFVYTMEKFEELAQQINANATSRAAARQLQREFFSNAAEGEPDKQGKVLLTQEHRAIAGISKDVVIVGAGSRIEIWSADRWEASQAMTELPSLTSIVEGIDGICF